jgi:hypothetical protein
VPPVRLEQRHEEHSTFQTKTTGRTAGIPPHSTLLAGSIPGSLTGLLSGFFGSRQDFGNWQRSYFWTSPDDSSPALLPRSAADQSCSAPQTEFPCHLPLNCQSQPYGCAARTCLPKKWRSQTRVPASFGIRQELRLRVEPWMHEENSHKVGASPQSHPVRQSPISGKGDEWIRNTCSLSQRSQWYCC